VRVQLVLTDDWELRGDGSGNMRRLQFDTIRRLSELYERHGVRGSFNAEVLQQLAHRRLGERHPELAELAQEWEAVITEIFRRGHDVQLHLHPQWLEARYADGRWQLSDRWSLVDYDPAQVGSMLRDAKVYLEGLLSELDPGYRCVSFRSGSWCIAPSPHVLPALIDTGIVFDMSIVAGVFYRTRHINLDYRNVDEGFLPFYPDLADARRLADRPQPIVCVPTHTFVASGLPLLTRAAARRVHRKGLARSFRRFTAPADAAVEDRGYDSGYSAANWAEREPDVTALEARRKLVQHRISDLSNLSFGEMRQMLSDLRRKAGLSGWDAVPVVLENHTKDIGDFRPIERFLRLISRANDIEVLTLTELAANIESGVYPVRLAS
jgi:hypothetical protein